MYGLITSPDGDSPVSTITNETLAALMQANHVDMSRRIDALTAEVKETNGRLRTAESEIAVAKSELAAAKSEIVALKQRQQRQPMPSGPTPAVSSMVGSDLELNVKRLSAWIAGGLIASWGAVKLIWLVGDWLQKAGLR
jgi:Tfp pilus assembly protein FimV